MPERGSVAYFLKLTMLSTNFTEKVINDSWKLFLINDPCLNGILLHISFATSVFFFTNMTGMQVDWYTLRKCQLPYMSF